MVKLLIAAHVYVDTPDIDKDTPLLIALYSGFVDIAKLLIEAGNQFDLPGSIGATQHGHTDVVKLFLDYNIAIGRSILVSKQVLLNEAKNSDREDQVTILFNNNDISDKISDFSPLHAAVFFGHTEIVKLLLDNGADPALSAEKISSLDFAHAMGHRYIYQLLYERLSNIEKIGEDKKREINGEDPIIHLNAFPSLPRNIKLHIFSFLTRKDKGAVACVDAKSNNLVNTLLRGYVK